MRTEGNDGLAVQFASMFLEESAEDVGRLSAPNGTANKDIVVVGQIINVALVCWTQILRNLHVVHIIHALHVVRRISHLGDNLKDIHVGKLLNIVNHNGRVASLDVSHLPVLASS